jgi:hypothetical protein
MEQKNQLPLSMEALLLSIIIFPLILNLHFLRFLIFLGIYRPWLMGAPNRLGSLVFELTLPF